MAINNKLKLSFHAKYLKNIRLVLLLVFVTLAIGITSLLTLPRRLNPEIKLTIVQVMTVLPGAGPEDVESLITIPLEDKLTGLNNLDTITSVSQENVSVISMQFLSGTDKDKARNDAQNAVNEVTTLPAQAKTPQVEAFNFENQAIWTFSVSGEGDYASLMRFVSDFKDKIKELPHVDHVDLTGFDTQEIQIVVNPEKVAEYGINPLAVSTAIKNATQAFPAGQIDTGNSSLALAIETQAKSVEDLRNIHLFVEGQPLKLGDVATVSQRSKTNQQKVMIVDPRGKPRPAVVFSVFKTTSSDIDKTVKDVEKFVEETIKDTNGRFKVKTITNAGEEISKQFTDLIGEFQSTLILVFVNLFLFLGVRQALIAITTIPLTFLLAFFWMNLTGQTINFISLFALLLAFGTSIDDTIVTVSAMTNYYRTKKITAFETGLLVWKDFIVPIWTTTITTVWAFVPLILTTGIIGEFIKPIPIMVAATMYSSTFVAWFITLPMIIVLLKPEFPRRVKILLGAVGLLIIFGLVYAISPKNIMVIPIMILFAIFLLMTFKIRKLLLQKVNKNLKEFVLRIMTHGVINIEPVSRRYKSLISRILGSRRGRRVTLICILAFTVTAYALIPLGLVKNEFFPKTNQDTVYVNVEYPAGIDNKILEKESESFLDSLKDTPQLISAVSETGTFYSSSFSSSGKSNSVLFTLILTPKEERKISSSEISDLLRKKYENYTKGKVSVTETSSGPPAGADIQLKLSGNDLTILDEYANKTINYLKKQQGVTNIDKSIKGGTSKIIFTPDKAKLASNNITLDNLGLWLRIYATGFNFDTVKFDNKDEDVVFYTSVGNKNPASLGSIRIPTMTGSIPLISLGKFELKNNPTIITREAGKRTMSVTAGILPGYSLTEINRKLEQYANDGLSLPAGYTWKTGGVNEENQKSVNSIFRAMGLSFLLILATMVIEFGSYRQAFMILSLIPFAISGVFIIFGLTGTPLSFPALIGVLALFGVVVTNAMFIVEKINQNRNSGMTLVHSIADAGQSRLEPIMLTSLTSILGLVPITIANPLWRGLGGAIISGLLFSGLIMLFFIPVMYYIFYNKENK